MPPSTSHRATVERLVRRYDQTTVIEKAHGWTWYESEQAWIESLADCHGVSTSHATAAYAALSPRLRVRQNRRAMVDLLNGERRSGVFGNSHRKATAALRAGQASLRGPKVTRFACNLQGCKTCVTLDTHAAAAAGWDVKLIATESGYAKLEKAYQAAAKRIGIPPSVLQATLWVQQRGKAK